MPSEDGTTGQARGAVVLCGPASERLAGIAGTQFETAVPSTGELILHFPELDQAVTAGFDLASWARALPDGADAARILIVGATGSGAVGEALRRARSLLDAVPAHAVCLDAESAPATGIDWISMEPVGAELVALHWACEQGGSATAAPGSTPVGRWPMIGRRSELNELARSWTGALGDGRRLQLVAGEPGSGKTRLIGEAIAEIGLAGGLVLYGAGNEHEQAPYEPFLDAFSGPERPPGGPSPTFVELAGGSSTAPEAPHTAGNEAERSALFSAAVSELEHRCSVGPAALVIEDLHDCRPSTLQLLKHLARAPGFRRLLLIGTYRPTDLDPGSVEASLISQLRSAAGAGHTELGPLGPRALRGIAASFGLRRDELDQAAGLAGSESAGLPLYACELIRSIAATDGAAAASGSQSLQVLIGGRVRAAGDDVHSDLSVAAVAGVSFDADIVAAAGELTRDRLSESLRRAEHAGLIRSVAGSGQYAFEHALTRRCLYEELSGEERGSLHRRLALAMEDAARRDVDIEPGRIAQQWDLADPPDEERATSWAVRAAEHALARFDPGTAVQGYEQALEHQKRSHAHDPGRRCDLLLGLGTALRLDGDARFRETLLEAARLALELDDPDRLASAVLTNNRGFVSAIGEFDHERLAMLEIASERVQDESLRPLVLAQLALELTFAPERDRRHELAQEALRLARKGDDPRVLVRVLNRYLIARWEPGNARDRIRIANQAIKLGARFDDPLDLFHGLHWRGAAQIEACEIDGAHRSVNEQARIAARLGDPTAEWLTACSESLRQALAGKLPEAEAEAERAAALGQESDQPDALPFYASQIASIRWQQGRLGELAPLLDAALENHPGLPAFRSLLALARIASGNRDGAREALAVDSADGFQKLPRDPTWMAGVVTYAHVAAELDDEQAAQALLELLEPLLGRLATTSVSIWGLTDHAVGRLFATLGDSEGALTLLDRSMREYSRLPAPIWRGQAALDLAAVLARLEQDEPRQIGLTAEARAIGVRYGAGLLTRNGATPDSGSAAASLASEQLEALNLTDRQRDVVSLLARGMSNAEIAEELMISPSTVKRHLENSFKRTGVHGRKGLMALLYETA